MPINMCVSKIHQYLVSKQENNDRDQSYWHPSEIGGCPRRMGLKKLKIDPSNPITDYHQLAIFDNGHSLHDRYQTWFREVGVLATEVITDIDFDYSSVITGKPKVLVSTGNGYTFPFRKKDHLWIKGKIDKRNPWTPISQAEIGDEFYLVETPFEYEPWHMSGNIDAVLEIDGIRYINDIKSCSEQSFMSLFYDRARDGNNYPDLKVCHICGEEVKGMKHNMPLHLSTKHYKMAHPKDEHIIQVNAYMYVMSKLGMTIDSGTVLYENKNRQQAIEVVVKKSKSVAKQIDQMCKDLWEIVHVKKQAPPKPVGFTPRCFQCEFCEYKDYCWPNDTDVNEGDQSPSSWLTMKDNVHKMPNK